MWRRLWQKRRKHVCSLMKNISNICKEQVLAFKAHVRAEAVSKLDRSEGLINEIWLFLI